MRSGKLLATNDELIYKFLEDENYQVDPDGQIWTCTNEQGWPTSEWRKKSFKFYNGDYKAISYKNKKLSVHRIVYAKYVGKLEPDLVINHKDGDPSNNNFTNLELVTQSSNNTHRFREMGRPAVIGNRRWTDEQIKAIKEDHKNGLSYNKISQKYGIGKSQISYMINGKTWKNVI